MTKWEELTKHAGILQARVDELIKSYNSLTSFGDALVWDNDAEAVILLMREFQNELSEHRSENLDSLERIKQERSQKPFFQKVFSSRTNEQEINEIVQKTDKGIQSIENGIDVLHELMDKTPVNKNEQKEIVDELRNIKKELTLQKREINENLRQIRSNARGKTVNYTGVNKGLLGKVAKYQRASIRLEKERSLVPQEGQKAFIEKKLIAIERDLSWVLHFKGDDAPMENPQLSTSEVEKESRCSHCGRRIILGEICPGCGAVN